MLNYLSKKERGQVLVLFALGLVVLLGFTALAVDGAMVYSDRRFDQSAADSAAMSGAAAAGQYLSTHPFSCADTTFKSNTISNAQSAASVNAFPALPDQTSNTSTWTFGVSFDCNSTDNYLDVHVKISSETKTSFAHLFYGGHLINNVESTVRVLDSQPYAAGNAIVALDSKCTKDGVDWKGGGNGNTVIHEGSIFSNSCMNKSGGAGDINVSGTGGKTYGSFYQNGYSCTGHCDNPPFSPAAAPTGGPINVPELLASIPQVNCDNVADHVSVGHSLYLKDNVGPGRYNGGTGDIYLTQPGLYCIYGDITLSGGHNVLHGENVTLYFVNGGIKNTGNADLDLTAPIKGVGDTGLDAGIVGMVILMAPNNSSTLVLLGNDTSDIVGTVMAPYGEVQIGGSSNSTAYHSQIIGFNVLFNGTGTVEVYYDDSKLYHNPAVMTQYK